MLAAATADSGDDDEREFDVETVGVEGAVGTEFAIDPEDELTAGTEFAVDPEETVGLDDAELTVGIDEDESALWLTPKCPSWSRASKMLTLTL